MNSSQSILLSTVIPILSRVFYSFIRCHAILCSTGEIFLKKTIFIKAIIEFFGLKIFRNYSLVNMFFCLFSIFLKSHMVLMAFFSQKSHILSLFQLDTMSRPRGSFFFHFSASMALRQLAA